MMYIDFSELSGRLSEAASLAQVLVEDPKGLQLLRLIEDPSACLSLEELKSLVMYGYVNKVLLTFMHLGPEKLRSTTLYRKFLKQRRMFLRHLVEVVNVLDRTDIEYVIFKTLRPVIDTPVDIDIVVGSRSEAYNAILDLKKRFKVEVWDQDTYSIGMRIADFGEFVDFYVKPHVADIVYLDPEPLLRNKVYIQLSELGNGAYVPVPRFEYEFCAVLAHAIIKEWMVTLNDILTLTTYYGMLPWSKLLESVKGQKLGLALRTFFKTRFTSLPQKLGLKAVIPALYLRNHKAETLLSLPYFLRKAGTRFRRLVGHAKRVTYVRGFR